MKQPSEFFENNMELPLKVIKVDPQNKRIVLSVNAFFEGKGPEEMASYRDAHPRRAAAEPEHAEEKQASDDSFDEAGADDYDDIDDIEFKAEEMSPEKEAAQPEETAVKEQAADEPVSPVTEEPESSDEPGDGKGTE